MYNCLKIIIKKTGIYKIHNKNDKKTKYTSVQLLKIKVQRKKSNIMNIKLIKNKT